MSVNIIEDGKTIQYPVPSTGTVLEILVTAGGSGYTSAPTVTISGGGGTGATATANLTNQVVTSITITAPGSGFTSAPTVAFSGGAGTGAAASAVVLPSTLNEGQAFLLGQKLTVVYSTNNFTASASGANGDICTLALEGVWLLTKSTASGSGGAQGTKAYWDPINGVITAISTVTGAVAVGSFFQTCADADTTCQVKLFPA